MLIRSFRTIQPINIIVLAILSFVLRVIPAIKGQPLPVEEYNEPLSALLFDVLNLDDMNYTLNIFITGFLVFIQALLLNQIVNRYTIFFKSSYVPALMYIIIMNSIEVFSTLNPQLFCNFLLLIILDKIFSLYKTYKAMSTTFDLGVLFAVCSLLYFPYILLTLITWLSLIFFRPFNWREWFCGLLGLFIPYFFLFIHFYWQDDVNHFYTLFHPLNQMNKMDIYMASNDFYSLIPLLIVFIFSANKLRESFFKNIIQVRKTYQLLFMLIILSILSFYIKGYAHPAHFMMLSIPTAVYLSYYFLVGKRAWIYEGFAYLMLVNVLLFQII